MENNIVNINATNLAEAIKKAYQPDWIYIGSNGEQKISRQRLYIHLKENLKLKITDKGNLFLYDDKIYKKLNVRDFKAMIKSYLPVEIRSETDWEAVWKEFCTDKADLKETDFDSDENIIGFENGVLELDSGEMKEYSEDMLLTRIVPCEYYPNKSLDESPVFKSYLETLCDNNEVEMDFLLEYIGGILSHVKGWRFKKMLELVGDGNTGKTQLRELVMNLLGREHSVSIDMRRINDKFGTVQLYRKRLAGSGDMSTVEIAEMNVIKNLTGGDDIFAEYKGKDGFSFRYDGFLWFNANKLPHFRGDRGQHVYERFAIVQCHNIIPREKRDPQLLDKMMAEKNVIASVAVDKFKKAIERGYKFSESSEMRNSIINYQVENNSLLAFMKDCCYFDFTCRGTKRSDFNKVYKKWCIANRMLPERDREIGKQLEEYYQITTKKVNGYFYYPIEISDDVLKEMDIT